MVGKYGNVYQPLYIDDRFDYVLFSNDFEETTLGIWQVLPIPVPAEINPKDKKRLSRYPKTHPEIMLSKYEASLYIDANVQIIDKWIYDRFVELVDKKIDYAGVRLLVTGRDCIYRHAYDMCLLGAENDLNAIVELHELRKEEFPEHFGLNENNVIFRRHTKSMQDVNSLWWKWIVDYSFRDQFSYMYCLWKNKILLDYFLPIGEDSRNSTHLRYYSHNENLYVAKQKWVKKNLLEQLRNKCRLLSRYHKKYYEWEWMFICRLPFPKIFLIISGLIATIINFPLLVSKLCYNFYVKNNES